MVSTLVEHIRTRGHWDVSIRPRDLIDQRVDYGELKAILDRCVVRLRGWPVPFVEYTYERGQDWIGQNVAPKNGVNHIEAWRFFTSGQFAHLRVFSAEYETRSETPPGCSSIIQVWEILYYLTELFELAARLAFTPAGDEWMTVSATLIGLEGRSLVIGQRNRADFDRPMMTNAPSLQQEQVLHRKELASNSKGHAIAMTMQFVSRFGWSASYETLTNLQNDLLNPR